jgi:hypothetical protein
MCISTGSGRTFREFTDLLLHVRHRIPLRRGLLLRSIPAVGLLRMVDGRALRIRELAPLLLLRVLLVSNLLLVLEEQLARKLLVQQSLLGLFEGRGSE